MVTYLFKKSVLAAAMAASALAGASPAMAQYGGYRPQNDTGRAIAAAVARVLVGGVLNSNRHSRYQRCVVGRDGYTHCDRDNSRGTYNTGYNQGGYYQQGGYGENGGYYQNDGYGGRGRSYNDDRSRERDYDRRNNDDDDNDD